MVSWLGLRQGLPGAIDQFLSPAPEEGGLAVRFIVRRGSALGDVGRQGLGLGLSLPVVIGHKVDQCCSERYYPNQTVGDINAAGSDNQLRQLVSSFHRGWGDASKFSTLKTFI
jgi:hypothetical protein